MAVEKITLNLIPTGETPTIHAAQFDKERAFQIELKEGEDDFSPTGYTIELQVRKVDNNIVTAVPSQVSSNIVTFLTTEQMTACSGTNLAELQISKNNMSIATLHFYLVVQRDVLAGGLSSQSEIYDLEEQIAAIVPEVIGDEYYTADQVDEKIAEIPTFDPTNYYDKTQLYTKTETNGLLSQKANTSSLSTVAFTGSYDDLVDHPVIPDVSNYYTKSETYSQAEVNTLLSTKADTSSLSSVATSGSYNDLSDKPTIPTNVIFDNEPTENHGIGYTVTSEGIKTAIDNAFDYDNTASGSIIHISDGGDNIPMKSCEIDIAPDLTGHTEANLVVCGKNLLPPYNLSGSSTLTINSNNGVYSISGTASTYMNVIASDSFFLKPGTYTFKNIGNSSIYIKAQLRSVDGLTTYTSSAMASNTFTLTETTEVKFRFGINAGTYNETCKPELEIGNEANTFNQYNATTYNIPFGQTVTAGGTLDVISGELVVGGVTTQLTPVSPKTISGVNNIYNDCGDTAIEYFTSSADGLAALIEVLSNS